MIVLSHSSSCGLLIFVAYLEKGKVLLGLNFLKCVCIHVGLCDPPWENGQKCTEIFSKLNLKRKLICKKLHKFG